MARDLTDRRTFLTTAGAVTTVGLAGCAGGGGGDGGDGDGGGDGGDGGGGGDGGDGGDGGATTMAPEGDIVIGNAAPLSGPITPWGQLHKAGLEFAAQELNADGGVLGRDVSVVSQDTESSPQTAATVFRRLVSEEDAVAITGPVLSNVAIRVRQVAEEEQVPHLPNQGASANLLTKDTRFTFRVSGAATPWFARATAGFVQENGWTKYGAMIADYAYGRSYQEAMERYITSMNGLESTVQVAPVTAQDFTSQLRQMPSDIEFLDIGGHPIGIFTIVQQARELGLQPAAMSGPNIPTPLFYSTLGDAVESAGITLFPPLDQTSDEFAEVGSRYFQATDEFFDQYVAFGYVTMNLIAAALEEAGEATPGAVRDALSGINYDSLLTYPLAYNEWGELQETQLIGQQFTLGAPSYYPPGNYSFENVFETARFSPVDPTNWG